MKKSTYLKLGIFVLVVLLIYGMCSEPQSLDYKGSSDFRYRGGFYYVDSVAKSVTRKTSMDTFLKKMNIQAETKYNGDIGYRLLCGNDDIIVWFFVHSQNHEIHFSYIKGKAEVSEKEYDSLTKIYKQCYENQILSKLK